VGKCTLVCLRNRDEHSAYTPRVVRWGVHRLGAHLPSLWPWARRWINHWSLTHGQCDPTYGYLPSRGESRPLHRYEIILFGDRGKCLRTTYRRLLSESGTAGSWVQRPNHYTNHQAVQLYRPQSKISLWAWTERQTDVTCSSQHSGVRFVVPNQNVWRDRRSRLHASKSERASVTETV